MGARGPKPDPAQAAKGFPGRRQSKAKAAEAQTRRIAELLAPSASATVDLPPMLQDPKYAPAAALWRRLAPELRRTHRLPLEAEFYFIQVCVYGQEWVEATEDLHTAGKYQSVTAVAGGQMERRRPVSFDRQQAFQNLTQLSGRFGLTPMDMYDLFKGQAAVAASNPGLFGDERKPTSPDAPAPDGVGRVGGLSGLRSTPPSPRPN